jgi:hypothetical protein
VKQSLDTLSLEENMKEEQLQDIQESLRKFAKAVRDRANYELQNGYANGAVNCLRFGADMDRLYRDMCDLPPDPEAWATPEYPNRAVRAD